TEVSTRKRNPNRSAKMNLIINNCRLEQVFPLSSALLSADSLRPPRRAPLQLQFQLEARCSAGLNPMFAAFLPSWNLTDTWVLNFFLCQMIGIFSKLRAVRTALNGLGILRPSVLRPFSDLL